MKLYFAPLEGITTKAYRNAHATVFGGCDAYYAPFITPSDHERISRRGLKDILPEEDMTGCLKVQVLTNQPQSFLKFSQKIALLGYDEINLNLGCPMSRVVQKGRGSGFLSMPGAMEHFFEEVFSSCKMRVSVKTRLGDSDAGGMDRLMEIYNQHPLSLLIVHPRTRAQFYGGKPDMEAFSRVYRQSKNPLCYNGDVVTARDYQQIAVEYPDLDSVMIGRGAVQNPALFREIRGGKSLSTEELVAFSNLLADAYYEVLGSETFTLHKLKEIWAYLIRNYPEEKKIAKSIKKAAKVEDFKSAIRTLPELCNGHLEK